MSVQERIRGGERPQKTGILWWCGQIISWLVLFIVLALIALMIVIPKLGGATAYTVLTGSMRPNFPPGTLVVVKPLDPKELHIGDVATYQLKSGEPEVVTHRVVSMGTNLSGEQRIIFQGDANNSVDDPVRSEQIRGKLWYSLPLLGYVNSALSVQQRTRLTWVVAGGLIVYSLVMFVGAWRERQGKQR